MELRQTTVCILQGPEGRSGWTVVMHSYTTTSTPTLQILSDSTTTLNNERGPEDSISDAIPVSAIAQGNSDKQFSSVLKP